MNDAQRKAVLKVEQAKKDERLASAKWDAAVRARKRAEAELRKEIRLDTESWNRIEAVN